MPAKNPIVAVLIAAGNGKVERVPNNRIKFTACTHRRRRANRLPSRVSRIRSQRSAALRRSPIDGRSFTMSIVGQDK